MKKILIFSLNDGHFVDSLYRALGEGFSALGREVVYCYFNEPDFAKKAQRAFENDDIDFSIGQNGIPMAMLNRARNLKPIYESKEHLIILDDAPYNLWTSDAAEARGENLLIAYRDRSHLEYLQNMKFKGNVRDFLFLPFGALIHKPRSPRETKEIDVVFSGKNYGEAIRVWRDWEIDKSVRSLVDDAADVLESSAVTVNAAVDIVLGSRGLMDEKKLFFPLYRMLYQYCKCFRRAKLVKTMTDNGVNLTLCSDSWKNSPLADKLTIKHADFTSDVLNLYSKSKILLQDMAEFNDGSHCRVADGVLCGAMVVSERSEYLDENFSSSELFLFDWKNIDRLPCAVNSLLENSALRQSFANNAAETVMKEHLPIHSARKILNFIESSRKKYLTQGALSKFL